MEFYEYVMRTVSVLIHTLFQVTFSLNQRLIQSICLCCKMKRANLVSNTKLFVKTINSILNVNILHQLTSNHFCSDDVTIFYTFDWKLTDNQFKHARASFKTPDFCRAIDCNSKFSCKQSQILNLSEF